MWDFLISINHQYRAMEDHTPPCNQGHWLQQAEDGLNSHSKEVRFKPNPHDSKVHILPSTNPHRSPLHVGRVDVATMAQSQWGTSRDNHTSIPSCAEGSQLQPRKAGTREIAWCTSCQVWDLSQLALSNCPSPLHLSSLGSMSCRPASTLQVRWP